jgi:NitT/TauT family transport system substrate-binding protein
MEALLAGTLDATYVGPSPAINAHARSGGAEVRVLAGATRGGAALVVRGDRDLKTAADFRGRRVATPQLGNTQDVSCRTWLLAGGLAITATGGDAQVLPTSNADILSLFAKGDLDAAWTVEPWVSRLEGEAGGRVLVEEADVLTTLLACSARLLAERPAVAARLAEAHRELGAWIREKPAEAKALVRAELKRGTTRDIDPALLDRCWARMRFEDALHAEDFEGFAAASVKAGLLREVPDLRRLVAPPK